VFVTVTREKEIHTFGTDDDLIIHGRQDVT